MVKQLAQAVHKFGAIALSGQSLGGAPSLDHAFEMLADGVPQEMVRRHLERCIAVERARSEERFAVAVAAFDLIASGESPSYVDFVLDGLTER